MYQAQPLFLISYLFLELRKINTELYFVESYFVSEAKLKFFSICLKQIIERLACAAAAARESERAEINVDAEKLKYTGVNKEEKLKENEKDEDCVREDEKNEKEREVVNTGPEISEVYVLDVNETNTEASETVEACKIGITASTDSKTNIDNQKCDSCDSKDDHSNVKESERMDYNEDNRSSSKEKAGSPTGLKRALVFPSADDLSAKRACPDKCKYICIIHLYTEK